MSGHERDTARGEDAPNRHERFANAYRSMVQGRSVATRRRRVRRRLMQSAIACFECPEDSSWVRVQKMDQPRSDPWLARSKPGTSLPPGIGKDRSSAARRGADPNACTWATRQNKTRARCSCRSTSNRCMPACRNRSGTRAARREPLRPLWTPSTVSSTEPIARRRRIEPPRCFTAPLRVITTPCDRIPDQRHEPDASRTMKQYVRARNRHYSGWLAALGALRAMLPAADLA